MSRRKRKQTCWAVTVNYTEDSSDPDRTTPSHIGPYASWKWVVVHSGDGTRLVGFESDQYQAKMWAEIVIRGEAERRKNKSAPPLMYEVCVTE